MKKIASLFSSSERKQQKLKITHSSKQINLNVFNQGDQKKHLKQDTREKTTEYTKHPFNCIGKVVTKFQIKTQKGLQLKSSYGTGTLITPKVVITSAHNFYDKKHNVKAFKAIFYCFSQNQQNQSYLTGINIQSFNLHPNYFDQKNKFKERYDIAVALLSQNTIIGPNQYLKINWHYSYIQNMAKGIMVAGYSEDHQSSQQKQDKSNNILSYSIHPPLDQKQSFLYYKHTTFGGNSGGPILFRASQKQDYQLIAIHKGDMVNCNYGILINDCPTSKQIFNQVVQLNKIQRIINQNLTSGQYQTYQTSYKLLVKKNQFLQKQNTKLKYANKEHQNLLKIKIKQFNKTNKELCQMNSKFISEMEELKEKFKNEMMEKDKQYKINLLKLKQIFEEQLQKQKQQFRQFSAKNKIQMNEKNTEEQNKLKQKQFLKNVQKQLNKEGIVELDLDKEKNLKMERQRQLQQYFKTKIQQFYQKLNKFHYQLNAYKKQPQYKLPPPQLQQQRLKIFQIARKLKPELFSIYNYKNNYQVIKDIPNRSETYNLYIQKIILIYSCFVDQTNNNRIKTYLSPQYLYNEQYQYDYKEIPFQKLYVGLKYRNKILDMNRLLQNADYYHIGVLSFSPFIKQPSTLTDYQYKILMKNGHVFPNVKVLILSKNLNKTTFQIKTKQSMCNNKISKHSNDQNYLRFIKIPQPIKVFNNWQNINVTISKYKFGLHQTIKLRSGVLKKQKLSPFDYYLCEDLFLYSFIFFIIKIITIIKKALIC